MVIGIERVNGLTQRWVREFREGEDALVCGAGAWTLLCALLAGAGGETEHELATVVGLDRARAPDGFNHVTALMEAMDGVAHAAGIWPHRDVTVFESFTSRFAGLTVDVLPEDAGALDRWVDLSTDSMIKRFPVAIDPETRLVAATAIVADVMWVDMFEGGTGYEWNGRRHLHTRLHRTTSDLDAACIIEGVTTISRVVCASTSSLDVHLVAGGLGDSPADVVGTAIDAVHGKGRITAGSELSLGDAAACLSVEETSSFTLEPDVLLIVPAFEVGVDHDLLANKDRFGLAAATDHTYGHFPHLADEPLYVDQAVQSVLCAFSDTGFRAAAVTEVGMRFAGIPPVTRRRIVVHHDRSFGFIAVDRRSGLVVFAGWVHDVDEIEEPLHVGLMNRSDPAVDR